MNGLVNLTRLSHFTHLPIAFAQTELRAGSAITIAAFNLLLGQRLELRSLTLNVVMVLTTGVVPLSDYTTYRTCHVGLYRGNTNCSPLAYALVDGLGLSSLNAFKRTVIEAPGNYRVTLRNNTSNVDLSVAATGAVKLYF